ncbi:MAG: CPBP family intramembrane glutamic endopeptidase [Bacteriovoracaceae bacterium]
MQIFRRSLIICLCFASTVVSLVLANKIERVFPEVRSIIALGTAGVFGFLLYFGILWLFKKCNFDLVIKHFTWDGAFRGFIFGSSLFFICFMFLIIKLQTYSLQSISTFEVVSQLLFQVRPAVIEEVGFRFGLVLLSFYFYGWKWAVVLGSIPFGALHLLNFIDGQEIYWDYIIGTTAAGLFLSSLFLNFNLSTAISAHYTWNVLASLTSKVLKIPQEMIEGNQMTMLALAICSLVLLIKYNNQLTQNNSFASNSQNLP